MLDHDECSRCFFSRLLGDWARGVQPSVDLKQRWQFQVAWPFPKSEAGVFYELLHRITVYGSAGHLSCEGLTAEPSSGPAENLPTVFL
jgi:hypothetical protein